MKRGRTKDASADAVVQLFFIYFNYICLFVLFDKIISQGYMNLEQ